MNLILTLLISIFSAALLVRVFKRARIPSVVTLILFGLVIGYPAISSVLIGDNGDVIDVLGDIGLIALMFLAGLESDWKLLLKEKREAFVIAVFAFLAPFLLALVLIPLWGYSLRIAFVVAVAVSISAEATRAKVLMELGKLRTRLGAALVGAGIVDDVLGLSMFLILTFVFGRGHYVEHLLIIGSLVAFLIGVLIQKSIGRENNCMQVAEKTLNLIIIPFFFISIGLKFDVNSLILNPLLLPVIIALAFSGKFIGAYATKPLLSLSPKQLWLVGWSMNSRGALGLALALIAFNSELIGSELYSSLIIMAFVTTLSFPFVLYRMVERDEAIMDE
ncbi:MAG: cation:proton antiporter [Candidatus Methanospirareceae archaeon]